MTTPTPSEALKDKITAHLERHNYGAPYAVIGLERSEWDQIIAALRAGQTEGMVLVPREPTKVMLDEALGKARFEYGHGVTRSSINAIYRAMLAASSSGGKD